MRALKPGGRRVTRYHQVQASTGALAIFMGMLFTFGITGAGEEGCGGLGGEACPTNRVRAQGPVAFKCTPRLLPHAGPAGVLTMACFGASAFMLL